MFNHHITKSIQTLSPLHITAENVQLLETFLLSIKNVQMVIKKGNVMVYKEIRLLTFFHSEKYTIMLLIMNSFSF